MIDSLIRLNKKNYPQTLFQECKYKIKNNETENLINDDLEPSSSDKSDNGFFLMSLMIKIMHIINIHVTHNYELQFLLNNSNVFSAI